MKAFFALLAVAATASADAQFYYGSPLVAGSPLMAGRPLTYVRPVQYELKKDSEKEVTLKKIEEEQKFIAATPSMYYNTLPLTTAGYTGYPSTFYGNSIIPTTHMRIAKREAEADAQFLQYRGPLTHYNAYNMYAHQQVAPVSYSMPMYNPYQAMYKPVEMYKTLPVEYKKVDQYMMAKPEMVQYIAKPEMKEYIKMEEQKMFNMNKVLDNAREKVNTPEYAGKGMYVAENEGAVHIAKREADSQFIQTSAFPYNYNTLAYNNLAYNNMYANRAYSAFPYTATSSPLRYQTAYNLPYVY